MTFAFFHGRNSSSASKITDGLLLKYVVITPCEIAMLEYGKMECLYVSKLSNKQSLSLALNVSRKPMTRRNLGNAFQHLGPRYENEFLPKEVHGLKISVSNSISAGCLILSFDASKVGARLLMHLKIRTRYLK